MQYAGRVYKCTLAAKCNTQIATLSAKLAANAAIVKRGREVATFAGGGCTAVPKSPPVSSTEANKCIAVSAVTKHKTPKLCKAASLNTTTGVSLCYWTPIKPKTYQWKKQGPSVPVLLDLEVEIRELFYKTTGVKGASGWVETYDVPKKGKGAWGKLNAKSAGALAKGGVAIECDSVSDKVAASAWKWLKGGVYCD